MVVDLTEEDDTFEETKEGLLQVATGHAIERSVSDPETSTYEPHSAGESNSGSGSESPVRRDVITTDVRRHKGRRFRDKPEPTFWPSRYDDGIVRTPHEIHTQTMVELAVGEPMAVPVILTDPDLGGSRPRYIRAEEDVLLSVASRMEKPEMRYQRENYEVLALSAYCFRTPRRYAEHVKKLVALHGEGILQQW